jgi:predicted MPP superfamily phosphohydrolase
MLTRRKIIMGAGASLAGGLGLTGYAGAVEPMLRLDVAEYRLAPRGWPRDFALTIAVLADIHAVEPWMSAERIRQIAALTDTLGADIVLLAGDYESGLTRLHRFTRKVAMPDCAAALSILNPPLGVHAVLGNHDFITPDADNVRRAFASHGIPILDNRAVRLTKEGRPFWLLGLDDQLADRPGAQRRGRHDLPGTLRQMRDDAPAILLAHEPDIFPQVPARVALTIAGHTHGGQVSLPLVGPVFTPFEHGRRYVYGHFSEAGRDMVISAGLGMSLLPVRFGRPPEIVLIRLGQGSAVA